VGLTHSATNLTQFISTLADKGLQLLPNATHGSIIDRYLNGNVGTSVAPAQYYSLAKQASTAAQPWLRPYPTSLVAKFPARSVSNGLTFSAVSPLVGTVLPAVAVFVGELFLFFTAVGVVVAFLTKSARGSLSRDIAVLDFWFLVFLGFIRVSGTISGAYNSDRAELQAAIVMSSVLGLVLDWLLRHFRWATTIFVVGSILVMLASSTGEMAELTGGTAPVLLANGGAGYDEYVITDNEVAAAQYLVSRAGPHPLIYTDEFGILRIWDATNFVPRPHTLLTPGTINRGAWVYATAYNVVDHRAYGALGNDYYVYRLQAKLLQSVEKRVYSGTTSQVYH
jgi:hypothetical protein